MNTLQTLADMQLHQLIQKSKKIEECKAEWKSRQALDYPLYHSASGIKSYGG